MVAACRHPRRPKKGRSTDERLQLRLADDDEVVEHGITRLAVEPAGRV